MRSLPQGSPPRARVGVCLEQGHGCSAVSNRNLPTPKRTDERYLRGWYLVATKGNSRMAAQLARQHHQEARTA